MKLSKSQIEQFFKSPVWEEIEKKLESELKRTESEIENPEPFYHGRAVGRRSNINLVLSIQEILLTESEERSPYGNKGDILKDNGR